MMEADASTPREGLVIHVALEDAALEAALRERAAQPRVGWDEALDLLGLSEADIAAVDLSKYTVSTED